MNSLSQGTSSPPPIAHGRTPIVHVSVPAWALGALVVGLTGMAFVLGWLLSSPFQHNHILAPHLKTVSQEACGQLELIQMTLSPPPEHIEEATTIREPRKWVFPSSREAVTKFLSASGLSPEQQTELWSTHVEESPDAQTFSPSDEWVLNLPLEVRKTIYVWLGEDDRNFDIVNAYRYVGDSLDDWLRPAEVSPEVVHLIKSLSFQNGSVWLFADLRLVLPKISSEVERKRLIRILTSDLTYLVRLRLDGRSNIAAISDYWGRGGRVNMIRPQMESLAHIAGGEVTSLRAFLPPFVQTHLFTYPTPTPRPLEQKRDCHWTSFNFFNEAANDNLAASIGNVESEIRSNYDRVHDKFLLGDVILFVDKSKKEGNVFHSAVYITKDLVFTKNGRRPSNPWMFMKMDDMMSYYPRVGEVGLMYFRRHDLRTD